jgi:hypothetical protein
MSEMIFFLVLVHLLGLLVGASAGYKLGLFIEGIASKAYKNSAAFWEGQWKQERQLFMDMFPHLAEKEEWNFDEESPILMENDNG